VATNPAPDEQDVYAVVRLDSFRNFTPRPEHVTIRRVVHRLVDAEFEVRHLNMTAPTGTVYFIQRTTVAPKKASVGARRSPVVAATERSISPRPGRAGVGKTDGKKSKR
jgi:hypothetical protein